MLPRGRIYRVGYGVQLNRRLLGITSRNEEPRFGCVLYVNIDDTHHDERACRR